MTFINYYYFGMYHNLSNVGAIRELGLPITVCFARGFKKKNEFFCLFIYHFFSRTRTKYIFIFLT